MTPTKLLIGQIFVVFALVIAGVWAATQWCAAQLGYQPQLGPAWFVVFDTNIYRPWAIFPWWYHFEAYAPEVFDKAGMIAGASGFLGCASAIAGSLWRARQSRHVTTYGSARWATKGEIDRAGLLSERGVFLGRLRGRYLRHEGPEHVMAFAPTRSGKGVGLVIPTLLSWTGSAIIHDIKGENWQLTAGWRAHFSHVLLFNPTDLRSAKYNPLLEVRKGANEVRDVQNIADILVDPGIRVYLIAQSLNQVDKAYGEHNSILDNCHVRVVFSTNDERTAKRVSDALGVATEQRAMRNYAGHRLAPWLAHVMVSRQETARPLLTQGEVMQLPPADELVLVSGMAPIRAEKLQYYKDANFRARLLPPPALSLGDYADRPPSRPDDWTGLVSAPDSRLGKADEEPGADEDGGLQQQRHPSIDEKPPQPEPATQLELPDLERDDADAAADKRVMDRVRASLVRGHAMNQSQSQDLLPGL